LVNNAYIQSEKHEEIANEEMYLNKSDEENFTLKEKLSNKSEFLLSVETQINELLNTYEEEYALEELIPFSKFVKVDLEKNGNYYIFGVIYENDIIKYIVYGLPGEYNIKPEDEYANYYQFLPLSKENPMGYGYYLIYQEAETGEQVEMIIN